MSIPASVLARMATIGLSAEQADAVALMLADVEAATRNEGNEAIEARRANDRDRKARQRHGKSRDITGQDVTSGDNPPPKEKSPTPPKEITPSTFSEPSGSSNESAREFSDFWSMFPNKVGKRDAAKAFSSARKRAPLDAIMAGLRRYLAKTDDRAWCNPATFLNQDRWEDQPASTPSPRATAPPPQNGMDRMNAALDSMISGETDEPDQRYARTIEGSFERGDWGSLEGSVQRTSASAWD